MLGCSWIGLLMVAADLCTQPLDHEAQKTEELVGRVVNAVFSYKVTHGKLPPQDGVWEALMQAGMLDKPPKDSWGSDLRYRAVKGGVGFKVGSAGKDKVFRTTDDISSESIERSTSGARKGGASQATIELAMDDLRRVTQMLRARKLENGRAIPSVLHDRLVGYKLVGLRYYKGSIWCRLGIENGDIIERIDGRPVLQAIKQAVDEEGHLASRESIEVSGRTSQKKPLRLKYVVAKVPAPDDGVVPVRR